MASRSFPEPREESDSTFRIFDGGNPTRKIAFQASSITAGNTRTITMPDADVDLGAATPASHGNTLHTTGVTPTASAVGDAASEGSSAAVARGDHLHAREAFGGPGSSAVGDTAASGTATTVAKSDHVHGREAFGTPGSSGFGDAAAAGVATTLVRSDHTHGREASAVPSSSAVGDTPASGSATTISRSDHVHGREAFAGPTTSAVGDAAASGTAVTISKSDHRHGREAFGSPGSSAVGDSASGGAAATLARSDHQHGREAFAGPSDVEATAASGTATTINKSDHQHRLGITTTRGDIIRRGATDNERLAVGASSQRLIARQDPTWENEVVSINFTVDGGGSAITTGQKGHLEIAFPMRIDKWVILADQSGAIVVDIWKDTYANFPPTVSDTITGTEKPTLTGSPSNQDTNLTSWNRVVASGDILAFNVDSTSNVQRVVVALSGIKS